MSLYYLLMNALPIELQGEQVASDLTPAKSIVGDDEQDTFLLRKMADDAKRYSNATSAGTYPITITGTSGSLSHSASVTLVVAGNVVTGNDFTLTTIQAFPNNVTAGTPLTAKASLTPNYTGMVSASCDATAISGAQCTVTPQNPIMINANQAVTPSLALNLPSSAMPGTYNVSLTVADPAGQPSHTLQLPFTIIPDFAVISATPSQTVTAGQTSERIN